MTFYSTPTTAKNSDAAREIGDRTEGRARQAIDLGGSAENPLSFTVITTVAGNEP